MQEDEDPRPPAMRSWRGSPGGARQDRAVEPGDDPAARLKSVLMLAVTQLFQPGAMPGPGREVMSRAGQGQTVTAGSDKPRILLIPDCLSDPPETKDLLVPDSRRNTRDS